MVVLGPQKVKKDTTNFYRGNCKLFDPVLITVQSVQKSRYLSYLDSNRWAGQLDWIFFNRSGSKISFVPGDSINI